MKTQTYHLKEASIPTELPKLNFVDELRVKNRGIIIRGMTWKIHNLTKLERYSEAAQEAQDLADRLLSWR